MSGSELSDAGHTDRALEEELRKVVRDIVQSGELEELTVKRVRIAAEKNLGVAEGFYKSAAWKERSKTIIEKEAAEPDTAPVASESGASRRKTPEAPEPSKRQKTDAGSTAAAKDPKKMASSSKDGARSSALSASKDHRDDPPPAEKPVKHDPAANSESELSSVTDDSPKPKKRKKSDAKPAADDSSALSSLEDSSPLPTKKRGKQRKGSTATKQSTKAKAKAPSKAKSKGSTSSDPASEEIKSLQSWLVKCGIRKVWGKELKPYETTAEKIAHLRSMLADVGMTGRYSIEKAHRIRETRELQADLAAVQEGAKYWGKSDEEEERGERRRRLARPFGARRRIVDDDDDDDDDEGDGAGEKTGKQQHRKDEGVAAMSDEESD